MTTKTKIKLGTEVRDRVTGFVGIAVAKTRYLQGCDRVDVSPKVKEDMTLPDVKSFDEPDLEFLSYGILPEPEPMSLRKTGGPHRASSRSR